ncbi:MAG: hypothetical protein JWO81_1399 [Alphaproteobacteria bacterium]|nr:hypothetical protein [Alphaproteobacteria bacterium]
MVKPWELDWSTDAPAPDALALPIVPFFGRERPPMLDDGGVGMDFGAMPLAGSYGMATDAPGRFSPVASLIDAGNLSPITFTDPVSTQAGGPPTMPSIASPRPFPPTSLPGQASAPLSTATDPAPRSMQPGLIALASTPDPFSGAEGGGGHALPLPPRLNWGAIGPQVGNSFEPSRSDLAPLTPTFVARQSQLVGGNMGNQAAFASRAPAAFPPVSGPETGSGIPSTRTRLPNVHTSPLPQSGDGIARPRELGTLSASYETGGKGPGTVSNGRKDPGGVSYGSYQLSSTKGQAATFLRGGEAGRWAGQFTGLIPGTPAFTAQWKNIAAQEPQAFEAAQHAYIERTHYSPAVGKVARATRLDLDTRSNAVRNATWSVAVQHGGAAGILSRAIINTDRSLQRSDPRYDDTLIDNIYNERSAYVLRRSDKLLKDAQTASPAKRKGLIGQAQTLASLPQNRYARERIEAHQMQLRGQ